MFKDLTLFNAIKIGGPVMYLLILCSIFSIAVIIERLFYYYQRSRQSRDFFMRRIRELLAKNDVKKAIILCKECNAPFVSVIQTALNFNSSDEVEMLKAMERETIIETSNLERRTAIIGTIASTAVYIGLLGTVWGIIKTFKDIAETGSGGIDVVTAGISEALVCTAAGLFVSIPAVVAYNYFVKRVNEFVTDMELCASEMPGLLKERKAK